MTDPRRKINGRKPDPRKDKLAYFADNIQTHDEDDFDPKMYYYHRPDKEMVNNPTLNDPQNQPSRYGFASPSPPPGIFSGHSNLPSMSSQPQPSLGARGPPSMGAMSNLPVQSPQVVSQQQQRGEMLRYGSPSNSMPVGHAMQNLTSMASASRTVPQMSGGTALPRGASVPNRMSTMSPQNMTIQPPQQQSAQRGSHSHMMTGVQTSQMPVRQMSPLIPNNPQMGNLPPSYNPSNDLLHMMNRGVVGGGAHSNMPTSNYPATTGGIPQESKDSLAFDISEFPVLGLKSDVLGGSIHKPMQKQPGQGQPIQSQKELRLSPDEFPTLPSVGYKSLGSASEQDMADQMNNLLNMNPSYQPQVHAQQNYQHMVAQGNQAAMRIARPGSASSSSAFAAQYDQQQYLNLQQQQRHPTMQPQQQPQQQPTQKKSSSVPERWGLLGLLNVIRMTEPDLNTLALGTDLTTLGLNLNSPDCLYASFSSPFSDGPSRQEPDFHLPLCYYMQPPMQPPELKVTLFSEETLFYVFYSMPRDFLQSAAAIELNNRDWRYHKEHQLWFTRVPGTEPLVKTATYERGSYIFFDISTWDKVRKDNFMIHYDKIAEVPKLTQPTPVQGVSSSATQGLKIGMN